MEAVQRFKGVKRLWVLLGALCGILIIGVVIGHLEGAVGPEQSGQNDSASIAQYEPTASPFPIEENEDGADSTISSADAASAGGAAANEERTLSEGDSASAAISKAIKNSRYPLMKVSDFNACSDRQGNNAEVKGYKICDDMPLSNCPYSGDQYCAVSGMFVDGRLRELTYKYEADNIFGDDLKLNLDSTYGKARIDRKPRLQFPDGSWIQSNISTWSTPAVKIVLMRMAGVNINGTPYDKTSVTFSDKSVPDPY